MASSGVPCKCRRAAEVGSARSHPAPRSPCLCPSPLHSTPGLVPALFLPAACTTSQLGGHSPVAGFARTEDHTAWLAAFKIVTEISGLPSVCSGGVPAGWLQASCGAAFPLHAIASWLRAIPLGIGATGGKERRKLRPRDVNLPLMKVIFPAGFYTWPGCSLHPMGRQHTEQGAWSCMSPGSPDPCHSPHSLPALGAGGQPAPGNAAGSSLLCSEPENADG